MSMKKFTTGVDYWFYNFEMHIVKRGWTVIDDDDIEIFFLWNVTQDIMSNAIDLIRKALTEKVEISGKEFINRIEVAKLGESIPYLAIYKRDE